MLFCVNSGNVLPTVDGEATGLIYIHVGKAKQCSLPTLTDLQVPSIADCQVVPICSLALTTAHSLFAALKPGPIVFLF